MIDIQKINDSLVRVYEILKLTPDEIKKTLGALAQAQQVAVSTELMKSFTSDELKLVEELDQKSNDEIKKVMEQIAKNHANDQDFKVRAEAAVKGVFDEHVAYLKTRGDDRQKEAIGKILAEIE